MELETGIFAVKLEELKRQYEQIHARLSSCQSADHETIRLEKQRMAAICRDEAARLQQTCALCRSPAVAALSGAQKEYLEKTEAILEKNMAQYMGGISGKKSEAQAEAMSLYAEYAIDFATQAVSHALLAAFSAIDLQMSCQETQSKISLR